MTHAITHLHTGGDSHQEAYSIGLGYSSQITGMTTPIEEFTRTKTAKCSCQEPIARTNIQTLGFIRGTGGKRSVLLDWK